MNFRKLTFVLALSASLHATGQNPYLPLWEYIPDGEPYVFEDPDCPGQQRVYVYGSHDNLVSAYCGRDQVVWSAPVDDLTQWRYDGIIFKSAMGADGRPLTADVTADVLFAPDVAEVTGTDGRKEYFLYPNNQARGREGMVARSNRPDGPFHVSNWSTTSPTKCDGVLRFDSAVLVDDDGRVYGYWGFTRSYAAELDPTTMSTVKPGCKIVEDMVPGCRQDTLFRFFEASSIRKIDDKYVFIYSRFTRNGEFGLPTSNYTLAYAYSDHPLGPWTYGGTIIDARARGTDVNGNAIATAVPTGNTHGSICKIGNRWWVFYHRQTGLNEFSRQAMVAPINVKVEKGRGGRVIITEGEVTSEGFCTDGLNPLHRSAAGWACYMLSPKGTTSRFPNKTFSGSYVRPSRFASSSSAKAGSVATLFDPTNTGASMAGPFNLKESFCPVVNNTNGSVVGYKYFNFSHTSRAKDLVLQMRVVPEGIDGSIAIFIDAPSTAQGGQKIGTMHFSKNAPRQLTELTTPINGLAGVKGKHPLFFVFQSDSDDRSVCELYDFIFTEARNAMSTHKQ